MDPSSTSTAELLANEAFVRRLARSLAADEAGADDLVQETWLAALEARPGRARLRAWLARVLRNLAASGLRGRARREARESACSRAEVQPDTAELVERVELHHRLVAAVLALPEAYREVILRHYFRGESVRAMSVALGRPEATVRTRLRRAREALRGELGDGVFGEIGVALVAVLDRHEPVSSWTTELLMKKALVTKAFLQVPLLVGGLLGAGLGFGGSLLVRGEPGEDAEASAPRTRPPVAPAAAAAPEAEPEVARARPEPLSARVPVRAAADVAEETPGSMSTEELRRLLLSSSRLDQARAIHLLAEEGSPRAHALLLETFLATGDSILAALLEEALLASGADVSAIVFESYLTTLDPARLERLAGMMRKLVEKDPALEAALVDVLGRALRDPGPNGERLVGLEQAIAALGEGALETLVGYLSDPLSDPRGTQIATLALSLVDPWAAQEVERGLGRTLDALLEAAGDSSLSAEERQALHARTSTLAWAAISRPPEEHDALGALLAEHLFRAADEPQAQTLAWGVTSLKGLSPDARQGVVRSLLDSLADQDRTDLRECYAWAVGQLATNRGDLDEGFLGIERLVRERMDEYGSGAAFAQQLAWLWQQLQKYREQNGG